MKRKNRIIIIVIVMAIAAMTGLLTQSSKWSQKSFEAVVKEVVTQSDGEVRFIVERTTEIYGSPLNSLGISSDTKLFDMDRKSLSVQEIQPGSSVKVTVKDAFTEETPIYYPVVYEIMITSTDK